EESVRERSKKRSRKRSLKRSLKRSPDSALFGLAQAIEIQQLACRFFSYARVSTGVALHGIAGIAQGIAHCVGFFIPTLVFIGQTSRLQIDDLRHRTFLKAP